MLSYRHSFHAGNHADVLKHFVLVYLLRHLAQKDKPFWYIDTHAGAGEHALDGPWAKKNAEFESGIARLWNRRDLPPPVADYVDQVVALNPAAPGAKPALKKYPGSSQIALQLMRPRDRMRLFELHSTEASHLKTYYKGQAPRMLVQSGDGFAGLNTILPPVTRRGLVLIDPSYEDKDDYRHVIKALKDGLERFATGTYMLWYPEVQRPESRRLPDALKRIPVKDWLHVALTVKTPDESGLGLHGSGLYIINPPWTLAGMLRKFMPGLTKALAQDASAAFVLETGEK